MVGVYVALRLFGNVEESGHGGGGDVSVVVLCKSDGHIAAAKIGVGLCNARRKVYHVVTGVGVLVETEHLAVVLVGKVAGGVCKLAAHGVIVFAVLYVGIFRAG